MELGAPGSTPSAVTTAGARDTIRPAIENAGNKESAVAGFSYPQAAAAYRPPHKRPDRRVRTEQ